MSLASDYYVDADKSDDTGDGLSWGNAKKHLSAVLALIVEPITSTITVHLKSTATPYTDNHEARGISFIGENADALVIQPDVWNQTNYEDGVHDPLGTTGTGTFDAHAATFPVTLQLKLELWNCFGVVLKGLHFDGAGGDVGLRLMEKSVANALYCRFAGSGAMEIAMMGSLLRTENCDAPDNNVAYIAMAQSQIQFLGDNIIVDAATVGVFVTSDSIAWVMASGIHHTMDIVTTTPRVKQYAAMRATAGSKIYVMDENLSPFTSSYFASLLNIHHNNQVLRKEHFGIVLESGSLLTGASQISFTKLDSKGETVPVPEDQAIVEKEGEKTTKIE